MQLHFVMDSVYTNNLLKAVIEKDLLQDNKFILIHSNDIKYISKDILKNVIIIRRSKGNFRLSPEFKIVSEYVNKASKIFFHYLSFEALWIINSYPTKLYGWFLWGGDFYPYININQYHEDTLKLLTGNKRKKSFKLLVSDKIALYLRNRAIKNIDYIYTWNDFDYKLLKSKINTKAKFKYFTYPNINDYSFLDTLYNNKVVKDEVIIQLGNSGDATNNHMEIINEFKRFKNHNYKLIVPLSYGDMEYVKNLICEGKKVLGEKFVPITEHMPLDEYYKLLSSVDVAIMNHYRQQGAGNIVTLLYLGKKVFLNKDVTTFKTFKEWGVNIFDTEGIKNISFDELIKISDDEIKANRSIIKEYFGNDINF